MNPKASSILEKAHEDRRRSNFKKALSRVEEAIEKFPKELHLYTEAIDVAMEAGESLKAIQNFKRSQRQFPEDIFELWTFTVEKVAAYNDPIVGRFMIEHAIKSGDLTAAHSILQNLTDDAAGDLLERIRTKKQSVTMGPRATAGDDVVSYALGEALIHLRLGHLPEAVDGFVRVLEENPGQFKTLEPFLSEVEKEHGNKGEASFALGCCHIAGGRPSKGVENLVRAARRAPALASRVIQKIESIGDHPDLPLDRCQLKLIELYLSLGDRDRASELSAAILDRNEGLAGEIADVLTPAVQTVGESLEIHFVFVRASSTAGRKETALSQLRKIHRCREHKARLVEWMESRSRCEQLSTDLQFFFAETALSEGLHGKALEIIGALLSLDGQDRGAVKELLSRYQSVPLIQHFYNERFGASLGHSRQPSHEFEKCDDTGFASAQDPISGVEPTDGRQTDREAVANEPAAIPDGNDGRPREDAPDRRRKDRATSSVFENRDFSLSMHAPGAPSTHDTVHEDSWPSSSGAEDSDLFEYLKRDFSGQDRAPCDTAGFDSNPPAPPAAQDSNEPAASGPVEDTGLGEPEPHSGISLRDDETIVELSEASAADFAGDTVDRARPIELVEAAYNENRMTEMKRLLDFEPANLGEDIARKHQLARYYLAMDRPLSALVALKSVQPGALSKEEKKTFMLLIAQSYRGLHNFEAAHGVYLRIMSEHPGDGDIEIVARANYGRYIEAAAGAVPTLEKLTNL
jgi:tetratricopeptide (TPR) repeat protein